MVEYLEARSRSWLADMRTPIAHALLAERSLGVDFLTSAGRTTGLPVP